MGICEIAEGGENIAYVIITGILMLAIYYDLRTFKIPNVICAAGCLMGLIYMFVEEGSTGLCRSCLGILLPVVSLFFLFCIRVIGAGDIKLISAIGAFISKDIIWVMLISFLLSALYGIFLYFRKFIGVIHKRVAGKVMVLNTQTIACGLTRIHFSVPIALGTWIFMLEELLI